jgi:hypothetical protein
VIVFNKEIYIVNTTGCIHWKKKNYIVGFEDLIAVTTKSTYLPGCDIM